MIDVSVFDIDQDFFFKYNSTKNMDELEANKKIEENKSEFTEFFSPKHLIEKYSIRNKPYFIFRNHEEALYKIRELDLNNIKLLHFDAHDDLERDDQESTLNKGNWVSFLINERRCSSVDWITPNFDGIKNFNDKTALGTSFNLTVCGLENHPWAGRIDYVFYTLSPEFCVHQKFILEFVEEMERDLLNKNTILL